VERYRPSVSSIGWSGGGPPRKRVRINPGNPYRKKIYAALLSKVGKMEGGEVKIRIPPGLKSAMWEAKNDAI